MCCEWISCIGRAGAKSIAEALKWNSSLECLDLFGSNMKKEGYLAFAKALKERRPWKIYDQYQESI